MPEIALRTTCLVGFPGETDAHFQHLYDFLRTVQFEHVGVFVFSPEEGTAASVMPNRPSETLAGERREALMDLQRTLVARRQKQRVGRRERVLLEDVCETDHGDPLWTGRSQREAPDVDGEIVVNGVAEGTALGSFLDVHMVEDSGYDMIGEVC